MPPTLSIKSLAYTAGKASFAVAEHRPNIRPRRELVRSVFLTPKIERTCPCSSHVPQKKSYFRQFWPRTLYFHQNVLSLNKPRKGSRRRPIFDACSVSVKVALPAVVVPSKRLTKLPEQATLIKSPGKRRHAYSEYGVQKPRDKRSPIASLSFLSAGPSSLRIILSCVACVR